MIINTDHKTFNVQSNYIARGNVLSNTLKGVHIRSLSEHGEDNNAFDIGAFYDASRVILSNLRILSEDQNIYAYQIFHYSKKNTKWGRNRWVKVIHGYVVTDENHNFISEYVTGKTYKSYSAVSFVKNVVSKGE